MARPKKEKEAEAAQVQPEQVIETPVRETNIKKVVQNLKASILDLDSAMNDFKRTGRSLTRLVYAKREITSVVKYLDVL